MNSVAIQHSSQSQSKILKVEWNLGMRCNFNCSYCDEYTHDNSSPYLQFEVAKKTIDKLISKVDGKVIKVNLTGGEPTVNKDFEKILNYMYDNNILVGLTTNGSRTLEFYKTIVPKLKSIIFSYHMEYHKREVVPENVIELFKFIQELRIDTHIHVHMMMLPTRFEEARNTIELFKSNGIPVVLRTIRPAYIKFHEKSKFNSSGKLIEGVLAKPFYDGKVTLLFKNGYPYYGETGYYSEEETTYLKNNNV